MQSMKWRAIDDAWGTCIVSVLEIVAANLTALFLREKRRGGPLRSLQRIEDATVAAGRPVGRSTIDRMMKGKTDFEIGNLEVLAKVFDVEVWQLLAPTFAPDNLPVIRSIGEVEDELYRRVRGKVIEDLSTDLAAIEQRSTK